MYIAETQVLDFDVVIDAMVRTFATEAGLLDTAKGHMFGREDAYIHANHAIFQCLTHSENAPYISGVKVAGQPKICVVGSIYRVEETQQARSPKNPRVGWR